MPMLLLAAVLTPAVAGAPVEGATQVALITEDCSTPDVDTNSDGLTPAEGDAMCVFDKKQQEHVAVDASGLSAQTRECRLAKRCPPGKGFRHGTTTDNEIHGIDPYLSEGPWTAQINGGFFVGGSPDLPGLLLVDDDIEVLERAIQQRSGEVAVAVLVPEGWGARGFEVEVHLDEELGHFLVVADRYNALADGVPFGETGLIEQLDR